MEYPSMYTHTEPSSEDCYQYVTFDPIPKEHPFLSKTPGLKLFQSPFTDKAFRVQNLPPTRYTEEITRNAYKSHIKETQCTLQHLLVNGNVHD